MLLLLLPSFLLACSGTPVRLYEGAPRPAGEVATLSMPEALEVARVNGVEIKGASGMLKGGDKRLELAPGRYELLIFYREVWESGGEHDVLRSSPALFVLDARAGHRYRAGYELPSRYEQAKALASGFSGWIEDQADGSRVASQASGLKFTGGLLGSLANSGELVPDAAASGEAKRNVVAPLSTVAVTAAPALSPTPSPAGTVPADNGRYAELMRVWWKQANAEERREFLRWVAAQP